MVVLDDGVVRIHPRALGRRTLSGVRACVVLLRTTCRILLYVFESDVDEGRKGTAAPIFRDEYLGKHRRRKVEKKSKNCVRPSSA